MDEIPDHIKVISIMLDTKTGAVNVNGPIGDKVMCYGMLQMAHEAIYEHGVRMATERNRAVKDAEGIIKT